MRILCPSCEEFVALDEGLQSATCPQCQQWLHAIQCTQCEDSFVALGDRTQRCPRCGTSVHFAGARLRTFADARDPDTDVVLVVEPRRPLGKTRMPPRGWVADPHAVPRFLVGFFGFVCAFAIVSGVVVTAIVDQHLVDLHNASGVIWGASIEILASTAVSAALFAFCSYALALLLEILERPVPAAGSSSGEGAASRELLD